MSAKDPASSAVAEKPVVRHTVWSRLLSNLRTIAGALLLAGFIRVVLFEAFEIEGPSMQPTLLNGDRVVVAKFMYGLFIPGTSNALVNWSMPSPGEVVIVKSTEGEQVDIVKRVIGIPGDTIEVKNNIVWRNGAPIPTRNIGPCQHLERTGLPEACEWREETLGDVVYRVSSAVGAVPNVSPVRVGPDHVFVLGDHRDHSNDSRFFGPVPVKRVKGQALAIYWSHYREVERDPASGEPIYDMATGKAKDHVVFRWERFGQGIE